MFFFGRNDQFIFNIIEAFLFRPKSDIVLEYQLSADDFSFSITTQGDTPSFPNRSVRDRQFALG
jgi:hypothetical protein